VAEANGHSLDHVQSNHEGDIVDAVQEARERHAAIVINPGAFTHYSYAIADALATFDGPKIELHLSNPSAREAWRRTSVVAPVVTGTVAGFGRHGYRLALEAAVALLKEAG
jgi:3-dehydroquinate dehydratase-2